MFPYLFPQPREITVVEGISTLSPEIALIGENLSPDRLNTLRSMLTATGARLSDNENAPCIVKVTLALPGDLDMNGVPPSAQQEYYELSVSANQVAIRAIHEKGILWGIQTLSCLLRHLLRNGEVANLSLRDWPSFPYRGIFVENKWGTDRMTLEDWCQTIDTLAALKLNILGIGLYGCWGSCRFEGAANPTEFLMVPVKGHEELTNTHHLRWYSPAKGAWREENYRPFLAEDDMLAKLVVYGREHGVTIVPFVNSLGHNTLIPRIIPNLSAKDATGAPTSVGYCLSNPDLKDFLTEFYGGIIDRYFPDGCEYFHIQMDEVWPDHPLPEDPLKIGSPWCECPACKAQKQEDMLKKHIIWLAKMLVGKGVKKVFLWNDQLTRHMDALDVTFAKDLENAGLKEHVILDWWNYSNTEIREGNHVKIGKVLGLKGVVSPMTCYYNWCAYSYTQPNIALMMKMAHDEDACGTISYAVHSPSNIDHEALMAAYAWESNSSESFQDISRRWGTLHFQEKADDFLAAIDLIRNAATNPVYGPCFYYQYTYARDKWPRHYPEEAIDKLLALPPENTPQKTLNAIAADAKKAVRLLDGILGDTTECNCLNKHTTSATMDPQDCACINALRAEALRIQYYATAFSGLLAAREAGTQANGTTLPQKLREELLPLLAKMETAFPSWLAPAALHDMSNLLD